MFGTLIGYANETKNASNFARKKTIKVEFKNVKKGQTITVKSENGLTIYKQEIKNTGKFSKLFDFTALKNGNYTLELNKDFEIIIKNFKVENGVVNLLDNGRKKVFKPVIRTKGNLLYISKIAFNKKPLHVVLYYKDEIIVEETLKSEDIFNRIYKLSKNYVGDYKLIINSDNRTYIKDFTL